MESTPVAFVVRGPLHREDLDGLSRRVCALLSTAPPSVVNCHVDDIDADAVAVDALARLHVVAKRQGCTVVLCNASPELRELVRMMGLAGVLAERP